MKITVLMGSPHRDGASALLAENFIKGAMACHEIFRFDTTFKTIHSCIACEQCKMNGPCVFHDDIDEFCQKFWMLISLFLQPRFIFIRCQRNSKPHLIAIMLEISLSSTVKRTAFCLLPQLLMKIGP